MASRLIITVHGIRTFGQWQERLERLVTSTNAGEEIEIINYKYGYFSIAAFIIPIFRWLVVRRFVRELISLCEATPRSYVDLVGHSFGTHVIGWALADLPRESPIKIRTVILAGSVLRPGFAWRDLVGSRVERLVNDCGTKDWILVLSQFLVLFTGMAGRTGFSGSTSKSFRNRYSAFGHSGYFLDATGRPDDQYMRTNWVPLLNGQTDVPEFDCRVPTPFDGLLAGLANNAEPVKLCLYLTPLVLLNLWIYGLYTTAETQRQLAQQALNQATVASNGLIFEIVERFRNQKNIPQNLIAAILQKAEALVDGFDKKAGSNPALQRALGLALTENSAEALRQRDAKQAIESAKKAIQLFDRSDELNKTPDTQYNLAVAYDRLGDAFQGNGDIRAALDAFSKELEIANQLSASETTLALRAVALEKKGALLRGADVDGALMLFKSSLEIRQALNATSSTPNARWELSIAWAQYAGAQAASGNRSAAALSYLQGLTLAQGLVAHYPANTDYMRQLAVILQQLGDVYSSDQKWQDALQHYEADVRIMKQLVDSDLGHVGWRFDILKSYFKLGDVLTKMSRLPEAKDAFENGLKAALDFDGRVRLADWRSISAYYQRICSTLARLGDLQGARLRANEGTRFFEKFVGAENDQRIRYAESLNREAWYALAAGDFAAALSVSNQAVKAAPEIMALRLNNLHALALSGQGDAAKKALDTTIDHFPNEAMKIASMIKNDFGELRDLGLRASDAKLGEELENHLIDTRSGGRK